MAALALCVIGGAPPNFQSRTTSCLTETNAGRAKMTHNGTSKKPVLVAERLNLR